MKIINDKNILILFLFFAGIYVALAIIGGINNYSPVPFSDMWGGTLNFIIRIQEQNYDAWWRQHNEHRIVLARILFWVDFKFFNGQAYFLIIVNYLLAGITFFIAYSALGEMLKQDKERLTKYIIAAVILCLLFSWSQSKNLTWAFQSQFFLAQLLPLAALFLLHKSYVSKAHSISLFIFACLLGIAALGSMANGVLTLPLMLVLALILRMKWWQSIVLLTLAILAIVLYFYDYNAPAHHGSLTHALLHDPMGLLQYILLYLGNPIIYRSDYMVISSLFAAATAVFLITSAACFAWRAIKSPFNSSLQLALLLFLVYIGGTALATGGGRLNFGVEQALSGRYATPMLLAWSVLLILYAPLIARQATKKIYYLLPLLLIPILLLPKQLSALQSKSEIVFNKKIAALALELGVKDKTQILIVGARPEPIMKFAKAASEKNISIFDDPLIKDAAQLIGQETQAQFSAQCIGHLDAVENIDSDPRYVRIRGWLYDPDAQESPKIIRLVNNKGIIVGYALTGQERMDVAQNRDKKANLSGFKGYMLTTELKQSITLEGLQPDCELQTTVPEVHKKNSTK